MARMRLLDLVRPFSLVLPEVTLPYSKVDQMEKLVFTVCAAVFYILLAEVPVFGWKDGVVADSVSWLRPGLAMSHGTLAEFGVVPIVLAGMTAQMMAGLRKLSVSLDIRSDRALFQSLQKLAALGISAVLSVLVALSLGGSPKLTVSVFAQLFLGSTAIIYMDEVLSKEYGIVTGTVLFTMVRTAQNFAWKALSLESVAVPGIDGYVTYGALPALFFNLKSRSFKYALTNFVFRTEAPNLLDILVGVAVFMTTLYLGMVRLNLQIRSTKMRAQLSTFPVRLIYTGAQPVIYALSVLASLLMIANSLSTILSDRCWFARILGVWDPVTNRPLSGIGLYLTPQLGVSVPVSLARAAIYTVSLTAIGAYVGGAWTESSGFAPQDIAKMFKENAIVLVGKRDVSVIRELRRVIPLAATLGGLIICLLVAIADIINPNGWGSAMSIAALGVFSVFEQLASEGMVGPEGMQNFA